MNRTEQDFMADVREQFPVCKNLVYFDHAAVAPISLPVKQEIDLYLQYLTDFGGIHHYEQWDHKVEAIRQKLADFIGASIEELAFIKNTSAGLSLAAAGIPFREGDNVVVPAIEYPSNIYAWMNQSYRGVNIKLIHPHGAKIFLDDIENAIDKNTKAVSVSTVQFATGFKANLQQIADLIEKKSKLYGHKIFFCVDAIQSLGALKMDVKENRIDFLSADGHKWLLSPEGCGIFYCNHEIIDQIAPLSIGWKSVVHPHNYMTIDFRIAATARKFEEGSNNLMGIVGLGASIDLFNKYSMDFVEQRIMMLTGDLMERLKTNGFTVTNPEHDAERGGIVTFYNLHYDLKVLVKKLKERGIELSLRGSNIRLSPHFYNNEEDIDYFMHQLMEICI